MTEIGKVKLNSLSNGLLEMKPTTGEIYLIPSYDLPDHLWTFKLSDSGFTSQPIFNDIIGDLDFSCTSGNFSFTTDRKGNLNSAMTSSLAGKVFTTSSNLLINTGVSYSICFWAKHTWFDLYVKTVQPLPSYSSPVVNFAQNNSTNSWWEFYDVNNNYYQYIKSGLTSNQWYFNTITYDGSNMRIYLGDSSNVPNLIITSDTFTERIKSGLFQIVVRTGGSLTISNLMIFKNRTLSGEEILQIYNTT